MASEAYGDRHAVSPLQAAVLRRLVACRTAALGGHRDACDRCGYARVSYNSCRDQTVRSRVQQGKSCPSFRFRIGKGTPDSNTAGECGKQALECRFRYEIVFQGPILGPEFLGGGLFLPLAGHVEGLMVGSFLA